MIPIRGFLVSTVLLFFFLIPCQFSAAQTTEWSDTVSFLVKRFPAVYQKVGTVEDMNAGRIVFSPVEGANMPGRGRELLITTEDDNPLYLQETSALIKVVSVFEGKVMARLITKIGEKPAAGDNVVVPSSPTIYLYTNIQSKNAWSPYQNLLSSLLEADLEVVELSSPEISEKPDQYGILLRLEQVKETAVCKIQSVYSGNTIYSRTKQVEKPEDTVRPADLKIEPARKSGKDVRPIVSGTEEAEKEEIYRARQMTSPEEIRFRLKEKNYSRMVFCDMDGDNEEELALLRGKRIDLFQISDDGLVPFNQYTFDEKLIPIHLHAVDLDQDGGDELLVSLTRKVKYAGSLDNELSSLILTLEKDRLFPLASGLPWYLRAIENRQGERVALAQIQEPYDQYDGPIFRLKYNKDRVTAEKGGTYEPAAGIYSIYQFNLHPDDKEKVIILEPSQEVYGYYTPEEKVYAYSPRKYGNYRETAYPKKLAGKKYEQGGFEAQSSKTVFTSRRFLLKNRFDGQCFLINKKRRGQAGSMVDEGIDRLLDKNEEGKDSIVGLTWGVEGLVETWESEPVPRDIIDFGFRKNTGYLLTRDDRGEYAIEAFR